MKALDHKDKRVRQKEFSYVLPVSPEDKALVSRYQDLLAHGVARFADVYYNYLFDNPATAEVLYRYEADGGDISELVRGHLEQLIALFDESPEDDCIPQFLKIGRQHADWDVAPIWIQGAFQVFLNHLQHLVCSSDDISEEDRKPLNSTLVRLVFRACAITTEGYWTAILEQSTGHSAPDDHARQVMEQFDQMSWAIDVRHGEVTYISPAAERMFGDSRDVPLPDQSMLPAAEYHRVQTAWEQCLSGRASAVLCQLLDGDKPGPKIHLQFRPESDASSRIEQATVFAEDVTGLVFGQEQLKELAVIDPVTSLVNLTLWDDRLRQSVAVSSRINQPESAVVLIDLPDYNRIQDSHGLTAADNFLVEAASRLTSLIRGSDTVARVSEHEFGVLLLAVQDGRKAASAVVEKIAAAFQRPWSIDEKLSPGFHLGIAVYPGDGQQAEEIHRHAAIALGQARQQRVSCVYYRNDGETPPATQRFRLAGPLYHALDEQQFEMHYQPKVDMRTYEIKGVEALLRWRHPEEGMLLPGRFLDIAERAQLMPDISDWVLRTGMRHRSEWSVNGSEMPVAINVSASTFRDTRFVGQVRAALERSDLEGAQLEIEIREDVLLDSPELAANTVRQLADLGVRITIDDYGSGCCSLSAIAHLPIDTVKIDPGLLTKILSDDGSAAVVRAIIYIGHAFGFKVSAEAVEDLSVWELLESWGCDMAQGYHVTQPLPEAEFASQVSHGAWFPSAPPLPA